MRILIIEDDTDVQALLCRKFMERGCTVDAASSVRAAARLLTASSFDWLILDHQLPDGLGFDLLELLDLPDTRVVLYTGDPETDDLRMQAVLRGLEAVFSKTRPVSELVRFVCPPPPVPPQPGGRSENRQRRAE